VEPEVLKPRWNFRLDPVVGRLQKGVRLEAKALSAIGGDHGPHEPTGQGQAPWGADQQMGSGLQTTPAGVSR